MPQPFRFPARGWAALLPVAVVAFATSVPEAGSEPRRSDETEGTDGWTILQFQMADTDLEPFMMNDLTEMGEVGSDDDLNLLALVDRAAGYSDDDVLGLPNWEGAKLVRIEQGQADVLEDMGDVDTGDPTVLSSFIADGIARYPADNYALVLSDHGASWPGVGGDESADHNMLSLPELHSAIRTGLDAAQVDKLDLIGYDACLMATYEVAASMAPLADRMVASQELEPGHGWDYRRLEVLADDPGASPDDLGRAIVGGFQDQADDEGTSEAITLSLLDLTRMPALQGAVDTFSQTLQAHVAEQAPAVGRERAYALGFGRNPDPSIDTHMTDLGLLARDIGAEAPTVDAQAEQVDEALDAVVVDSIDGAVTNGASGLSIYFPPQPEYFSPDYAAVDASGAWSQFLQSYYGTGAAIPVVRQPRFVDTDGVAEVSFDQDGVALTGAFDVSAQENLTEATIEYGTPNGDDVMFFGEEPATISEDGSGTVTGTYDLTGLTISDGTDQVSAYLDLAVDESAGVATIEVPMAYYATGERDGPYEHVVLSMTLDLASQEVTESHAYVVDEELGTYGELTPAPAGRIVPLLRILGADGTTAWGPVDEASVALTDELQFDYEPLPSQFPLVARLTVSDFGGNTASISASFVVP